MFLNNYDIKSIFLNEEQDMGETTEKDSSMDSDNSNENNEEDNIEDAVENLDDGEGTDDNGGDNNDSPTDDSDVSGAESSDGTSENIPDSTKKLYLFKDYKELAYIYEQIDNCLSLINYKQLTDELKKIYNYIVKKNNENHEKLNIVMLERFQNLNYQDLLKLYLYFKLNVTSTSDLIKIIYNGEE